MLAAVGLDEHGEKHLLGLVRGSSENAAVFKDLLNSLVQRGVDANVQRLFVIEGSKALRSAIEQVYGAQALGQRCRAHKCAIGPMATAGLYVYTSPPRACASLTMPLTDRAIC